LTLPAYKWKWRMRHSCLTFARQIAEFGKDCDFDVLWATDMLDVATFRGFTPQLNGIPLRNSG